MPAPNPSVPEADTVTLGPLARAIRDAVLPEWPLPVSDQINPAVREAGIRNLAWINAFGLAGTDNRYAALRVSEGTAYCFPHADIDTLSLATDWYAWLFVFDDFFNKYHSGRTPKELLGMPREGTPATLVAEDARAALNISIRNAYDDLCRRTRMLMPPEQLTAFNSHLDLYFEGLLDEARYEERRKIPTLDVFRPIRIATQSPFALAFVEQSEGIKLPGWFYGTVEYRELFYRMIEIFAWINDVFSAAKEYVDGETHNNLVIVLLHRDGGSMVDAARLATHMVGDALTQFATRAVSVTAAMKATGTPPHEVAAVEQWICGLRRHPNHFAWYLNNDRYGTGPNSE